MKDIYMIPRDCAMPLCSLEKSGATNELVWTPSVFLHARSSSTGGESRLEVVSIVLVDMPDSVF